MASPFLRFLDHTQRRITVGRTSLDEWSERRRVIYLTTHNTHNRPGGIRTHDLSRRAAADLRLRPRGHWDRHTYIYRHIAVLDSTHTPVSFNFKHKGDDEPYDCEQLTELNKLYSVASCWIIIAICVTKCWLTFRSLMSTIVDVPQL